MPLPACFRPFCYHRPCTTLDCLHKHPLRYCTEYQQSQAVRAGFRNFCSFGNYRDKAHRLALSFPKSTFPFFYFPPVIPHGSNLSSRFHNEREFITCFHPVCPYTLLFSGEHRIFITHAMAQLVPLWAILAGRVHGIAPFSSISLSCCRCIISSALARSVM